jgi:hypothetical protein
LSNIASSSHSPKKPYTDTVSSIRLSCWSHISSWLLSTVASFVKYNHTHHMNSKTTGGHMHTTSPLYCIASWNQPGMALQYCLLCIKTMLVYKNRLHYEIVSILLLVFMTNGTALHADPGTIIPSLKQAPSPSFVSITMAM